MGDKNKVIVIPTFIMADLENAPIVPTETLPVSTPISTETITEPTTAKSESVGRSEVRNPDKLLELFNSQKEELTALKLYKAKRDKELSDLDQERLKKDQQYEALFPIKIEEAVKPYLEKVNAYEADKLALSNKLQESETKYQKLQESLKVSSQKELLYSEFTNAQGNPKVTKEALWKLYGSDVKTDKDGHTVELPELIKTIQSDSFGSSLFVTPSPSGSGTSPQTKANTAKLETDKPRSVTQAMLLNPRKHGINMADISSGKIVVEG